MIKNGVGGEISKNPLEITEQLVKDMTTNVSCWEDLLLMEYEYVFVNFRVGCYP